MSGSRGEDGLAPISRVLDEVLDRAGVKEQLRRNRVLEDWGERVGETIARVARPRRVSGTTLIVEVDSSAWLMELDLMKRDIMARVNAGRGEGRIERLVFVMAEHPEGKPR